MSKKIKTIMQDYIYHHGIKGQKWGVRRFQNEDGTRTAAGKKREADAEKKRTNRALITGVATGIVASAAVVAGAKFVSAHKDIKVSNLLQKSRKAVKHTAGMLKKSAKSGLSEGLSTGTQKAVKTIAFGGVMVTGKKFLDHIAGTKLSDTIYKANDNKKIGNFWKTGDDSGNKENEE